MLRTHIGAHEVGLWYRDRQFKQALGPGVHRVATGLLSAGRNRIERVNTYDACFEHPLLDLLVEERSLLDMLAVVDLAADQLAFVWKDGQLGWILGPGRHAFWKHNHDVYVEVFNTNEMQLDHPMVSRIVTHPSAPQFLDWIRVHASHSVLVHRDGEYVTQLEPGLHAFWIDGDPLHMERVDPFDLAVHGGIRSLPGSLGDAVSLEQFTNALS